MKWILIALAGALAGCSTTTQEPKTTATTVAAPHASLANYHTFSFGPSDPPKVGYEVTPRSLEVQRRLRLVVLGALQRRGYQANDAQGDLHREARHWHGARRTTGRERCRKGDRHGPRARLHRNRTYEGSTGSEVWQGAAFAEIDPAKIDDSLLEMGVAHMLQDFPARDPGSVATAH